MTPDPRTKKALLEEIEQRIQDMWRQAEGLLEENRTLVADYYRVGPDIDRHLLMRLDREVEAYGQAIRDRDATALLKTSSTMRDAMRELVRNTRSTLMPEGRLLH